jgi:uncharacterized membrane protein
MLFYGTIGGRKRALFKGMGVGIKFNFCGRILTLTVSVLWIASATTHLRAATPGYTITDIGVTYPSFFLTRSLNNSGAVAYCSEFPPSDGFPHLWQNGTNTSLTVLGSPNLPIAINSLGHVAGGFGSHALVLRNGVVTDMGAFVQGAFSVAFDINDSDWAVGSSRVDSQNAYRAFLWKNGPLSALPAPGGSYAYADQSEAFAINGNGDAVGYFQNISLGQVAVKWSNNTATTLGGLPDQSKSEANDINLSGQAVGFSQPSVGRISTAVLWNGTTPTPLAAVQDYPIANALGIDDSGDIVGTAQLDFNNPIGLAILWHDGTAIDLNTRINPASGWNMVSANAINNSGQIVGMGYYQGDSHAFLLTPTPEPSILAGLSLGISALGLRLRRF